MLTEAYEYLSNHKPGTVNTNVNDWQDTEREYARQRAAEYAQMKHEEFINSDYYKTTEAVELLTSYFLFFFIVVFLIGAPVMGYLAAGIPGLIAGMVLMLASAPGWIHTLSENRPTLDLSTLGKAIVYLSKNKKFSYPPIILANILLVLEIGWSTEVTNTTLILIFTCAGAITYVVATYLSRSIKFISASFAGVCVAPTIVNLLFIINYLFSSHPTTETYYFAHQMQKTRRGRQATSTIHLDGKKYEDYYGIRTFANYNEMKYADTITYTFEDGLLGLRVMKSYKFK